MKFSMNWKDWRNATRHVKKALTEKATRPVLAHAKYEIDDYTLRIVAIDGFVLNMATIPIIADWGDVSNKRLSFVAPIPNINKTMTVFVDVEETQAVFTSGANSLIIPRVKGDFPDWARLIPDGREIPHIYFEVDQLRKALDGLPNGEIVGINFDSGTAQTLLGTKDHFSIVMPCKPSEAERFNIGP